MLALDDRDNAIDSSFIRHASGGSFELARPLRAVRMRQRPNDLDPITKGGSPSEIAGLIVDRESLRWQDDHCSSLLCNDLGIDKHCLKLGIGVRRSPRLDPVLARDLEARDPAADTHSRAFELEARFQRD